MWCPLITKNELANFHGLRGEIIFGTSCYGNMRITACLTVYYSSLMPYPVLYLVSLYKYLYWTHSKQWGLPWQSGCWRGCWRCSCIGRHRSCSLGWWSESRRWWWSEGLLEDWCYLYPMSHWCWCLQSSCSLRTRFRLLLSPRAQTGSLHPPQLTRKSQKDAETIMTD